MDYTIVGEVVGVFIGRPGQTTSGLTGKIAIDLEGIIGDRHRGWTRISGSRDKHLVPVGSLVVNDRPVTIVAKEEQEQIATALKLHDLNDLDKPANPITIAERISA